MPCMIAGASGGIAPAWLATMQRAAGFGQPVEVLPLDAEPVLVDRVVEPAGQLAEVLAAAPGVDVGAAEVERRGRRSAAGAAIGTRSPVRSRTSASATRSRSGRAGSATSGRSGDGRPSEKPTGIRTGRERTTPGGTCLSPGVQSVAMDRIVDRSLRPRGAPPRRRGAGGRADGAGVPVPTASPRSPAHDPSAPGRPGGRRRAARPRVRRRARRHGRRHRDREPPAGSGRRRASARTLLDAVTPLRAGVRPRRSLLPARPGWRNGRRRRLKPAGPLRGRRGSTPLPGTHPPRFPQCFPDVRVAARLFGAALP